MGAGPHGSSFHENFLLLMGNVAKQEQTLPHFCRRIWLYRWGHREPNGSHRAAVGPTRRQGCLSYGS